LFDHPDLIVDGVQLGSGDHQLELAETQVRGTASRFVAALAAALPAVLTRSASGGSRAFDASPTPPATVDGARLPSPVTQ
jgi:hypothetical protein